METLEDILKTNKIGYQQVGVDRVLPLTEVLKGFLLWRLKVNKVGGWEMPKNN